jgi:hypothetical protein
MRRCKAFSGLFFGLPLVFAAFQAESAERLTSIALKSNETIEVKDVYWAPDCVSILKTTPTAEILDGPSGVTVTIKEASVVPRHQHCAKPVSGGKLYVTVGQIDDYSVSKLIVRTTYNTKDGDKKFTDNFEVTLVP